MEQEKELFEIFLDLKTALTDKWYNDKLEQAHDIAHNYEELNKFISKMTIEDASQLIEDIKKAIRLYHNYDEITDKIFGLSQKYKRQ